MKKNFLLFTILTSTVIGIICCKTTGISGSLNISGVFKRQGNARANLLIFTGNNFINIGEKNKLVTYYSCCDTVSSGNFTIDQRNNLIYLSTPEVLDDYLPLQITESRNDLLDSVIIEISNPVEAINDGPRFPNEPKFAYRIFFESNINLYTELMRTKFNSRISFPFPKKGRIFQFHIEMEPDFSRFAFRNYPVTLISTEYYEVKDPSSNYFKVSIPDLTLHYMSDKRLHRDIVRIIDKNTLEWNGEIYKKENR